MPDTAPGLSTRRVGRARGGERSEAPAKRQRGASASSRRREGLKCKSPAGRLQRKARSRSDTPGIIAGPAAPIPMVIGIGAIGVFSIVVFITVITIIVAIAIARTMVLTGIGAVTMQRRASSPAVLTARTRMLG